MTALLGALWALEWLRLAAAGTVGAATVAGIAFTLARRARPLPAPVWPEDAPDEFEMIYRDLSWRDE